MSSSAAPAMASSSPLAEPGPADARHTVSAVYLDKTSFSFRARQRRFRRVRSMIEQIIDQKGSCRIADIGGTEYYWEIAREFVSTANVEIHLMNLEAVPVQGAKFKSHAANACDLGQFDDNSFDMVHSNSVIEHVGSWQNAKAMAHEIRRIAPCYYVQTPNFWFPYEPHFRFPCFQFLPEAVRYRLLMNFNLGFGGRRTSVDEAMQGVQSASLLDARQMAELFPDADILKERLGPFTKSIMAVRQAHGDQ